MKLLAWIIGLFVVVSMFGCTQTRGVKVDSNKLDQIKQGVTTKSEVVSILGTPNFTNKYGGKEVYTYKSITISAPPVSGFFLGMGGHGSSQSATIIFDENGVVESVSSSGGEMK